MSVKAIASGLQKENPMNTSNTLWYPQIEIMAEAERADFRREVEKERLVREALRTKPHQPGWLERRMLRLGIWMAFAGRRLQRQGRDLEPVPHWYPSFKLAK
jgi:hypothetical protein